MTLSIEKCLALISLYKRIEDFNEVSEEVRHKVTLDVSFLVEDTIRGKSMSRIRTLDDIENTTRLIERKLLMHEKNTTSEDT